MVASNMIIRMQLIYFMNIMNKITTRTTKDAYDTDDSVGQRVNVKTGQELYCNVSKPEGFFLGTH